MKTRKTLKMIISEAVTERYRELESVSRVAKSLGIARYTVYKYLSLSVKELEEKPEDVCVD